MSYARFRFQVAFAALTDIYEGLVERDAEAVLAALVTGVAFRLTGDPTGIMMGLDALQQLRAVCAARAAREHHRRPPRGPRP